MFLMTVKDSYCYVPFSEEKIDAQGRSSSKWQNSDSKARLFGSRHVRLAYHQPTFMKH